LNTFQSSGQNVYTKNVKTYGKHILTKSDMTL